MLARYGAGTRGAVAFFYVCGGALTETCFRKTVVSLTPGDRGGALTETYFRKTVGSLTPGDLEHV
jgi:hypothetical protein